jgi:hypothetical protein
MPGGARRKLSVKTATRLLDQLVPAGAVELERKLVTRDLLDDITRLDAHIKDNHRRIREVVTASETTLTEPFCIGPITAGMIIAHSGDPTRFASTGHYARSTAPRRSRRPAATCAATDSTAAVTVNSTGRCTSWRSPRSVMQPTDASPTNYPFGLTQRNRLSDGGYACETELPNTHHEMAHDLQNHVDTLAGSAAGIANRGTRIAGACARVARFPIFGGAGAEPSLRARLSVRCRALARITTIR